MITGVDVSHWQGMMDWRKAKAAGALFAWIKASEGTNWADPRYIENARGAAGAGLAWGPYHYYRNAYDPEEQARQFARVVLNGPDENRALPVALDLEDTKTPLDVAALETFVGAVAMRLGRPIIYTARWWANRYRNLQWLGNFPLWVAHYTALDKPSLPQQWNDWTVWQYTSTGDGRLFGAESQHIDLNVYRGSLTDLIDMGSGPTDLRSAVKAAAEQEHIERGIRYNPDAALATIIEAHGMWPTTNEFDVAGVVAQRAENRGGARVYWWDGDAVEWANL